MSGMDSDDCIEVVQTWQREIIKHEDTDGAVFIAAAIIFAGGLVANAIREVVTER